MALLLAAILAVGAVAGFAQDPCTDSAGMNDLDAKVRAAWADKTLAGKKNFVTAGKQFLEKFGACKGQEEFVDWLKVKVPDTETKVIPEMEGKEAKNALIKSFNTGVESKNWDQAFTAGKDLLAKYPDEFRPIEVDLAAIAGEQGLTNNLKYADDGIKYAKQSLADIEAGKAFKIGEKTFYGSRNEFGFKDNKDLAIGWLNLYAGYLTYMGKKDKPAALPHLYKATQAPASTDPKIVVASSRPVSYELIGDYYYEELGKIVTQIQTKIGEQKDTDTPEVAKQKVDEIKGLEALAKGYAERAMDAYGRASAKGTDAKYKTALKSKIDKAYKVRTGKDTGADAWVATAIAKPFVDPKTPVAPIVEAEAAPAPTGVGAATGVGVGTGSGTGVGAAAGVGVGTGSGTGVGAGTGSGTSKPATTPVANPPKPPTRH
jgi:hypothetical protein